VAELSPITHPPLPIAALLRRSRNAKSPKERHDTAYYAWEASVRLAAAARLAAGGAGAGGAPLDAEGGGPSGERLAARLSAPSTGDWVQAALLEDAPSLDAAALLDAHALLREAGRDEEGRASSVTPRALVEPLAAYRNRVLGHGAVREGAFYDAAAATLAAGLAEAWRAGVFAPPGARLIFVESVEIDERGGRRARLLELTGAGPALLESDGAAAAEAPRDLLPRRAYLAAGASWRALYPFVAYQDTELRERCLFYNGRRRGLEMLDFVSGECLRGKALAGISPAIEDDAARALEAIARGVGAAGGAIVGSLGDAPDAKAAAFAAMRTAPGAPPPAEYGPTGADEGGAQRLGDFTILGRLGAGGMGVVYLARQESLGRLVALKTLPADIARDETARLRFEREIAALSRCDHRNVVKILASGRDEARDVPYYAMEYVEGADLSEVAVALSSTDDLDLAISSAAERRRTARSELFDGIPEVRRARPEGLSATAPRGEGVRDRFRRLAALFRDAAQGVEHLHRSGVLHRDLKPGNIMVSSSDGRPVVMDLGLAAVADATRALTRTGGGLLGTLRYMPPEQVRRGVQELDERADVYALGASLYELAARRPLHDGDSEARLVEQVLHDEPVPADEVDRAVPRDLALVIRKAVEKDRRRRYETAADLAADLDAFIEGRPVSARPPTIGYLLGLAVSRHRVVAAATGAALLVLLAAAVVFVVGQARGRERERALRVRAEESRARAEELVGYMLFNLNERLEEIGRLDLLDDVALRARQFYDGLPEEERTGETEARRAAAIGALGDVLVSRARADDALDTYRTAERIFARLAEEEGDGSKSLSNLAKIQWDVARALDLRGEPEAAIAAIRRGAALKARSFAAGPRDGEARLELAGALTVLANAESRAGGSPAESERLAREALALAVSATGRPQQRNTVPRAKRALGEALIAQGRVDEAEGPLTEAYEFARRVRDEAPDSLAAMRLLCEAEAWLAALHLRLGRRESAYEHYRTAVGIADEVLRREPADAESAEKAARVRTSLAQALRVDGNLAGASALVEEAVGVLRGLVARFPRVRSFTGGLAQALVELGDVRTRAGAPATAVPVLEEALAILERAAPTGTAAPLGTSGIDIADARGRLGAALLEVGRLEDAERACLRALAERRALAAAAGGGAESRRAVAGALERLGRVVEQLDRREEALAHYVEGAAVIEALLAESPRAGLLLDDLASLLEDQACVHEMEGRLDAAIETQRRVLDAERRADALDGGTDDTRVAIAQRLEVLARVLASAGRLDEALAAAQEAEAAWGRLASNELAAVVAQHRMITVLLQGDLLLDLGRGDAALAAYGDGRARCEEMIARGLQSGSRIAAARAEAIARIAEAHFVRRDIPATATFVAEALGLHPKCARALAVRALLTLERGGPPSSALADAESALAINEEVALGLLARARARVAIGRRAEAVLDLEAFATASPGGRRAANAREEAATIRAALGPSRE